MNKNIKIFINYFLGPILFVWLSWSIYRQIQRQPNLEIAWEKIKASMGGASIWNLIGVLLLMLVNWGIEALKWKLSVQTIQKISFAKSYKAVLSGLSIAVSTPNRMGEYLGRVLYMDDGNRLKSISTTIVGSISQLMVTVFMGCIGLLALQSVLENNQLLSSLWLRVVTYGALAVLAVLTLFYFKLSLLTRLSSKLPGSQKFGYLVKALEDFKTIVLVKLLSLSMIRFLVFIFQYYLLFQLFGVDISIGHTLLGVSVSLLVMSVIPTFAIAELGLRGEVSLKLIGLFSANSLGILMSTLSVWLINLILPAIVGSLLLLGIRKAFKEKKPVIEQDKTIIK